MKKSEALAVYGPRGWRALAFRSRESHYWRTHLDQPIKVFWQPH